MRPVPFCHNCGNEVYEQNLYCERCGTKLLKLTEGVEAGPSGTTKDVRKAYNVWARGISVFIGMLYMIGFPTGLAYYFESGLVLVLICEIIIISISASLILLGLFPDIMNSRLSSLIDIESRFPEIVVGLFILSLIIFTIEPHPPGGWLNYIPFDNMNEPKTRFNGI